MVADTLLPSERTKSGGSVILARWAAERQRAAAPVQTPVRRQRSPLASRNYAGAAVNNLTASFSGDPLPINLQLERALRLMRNRSRDLAKNNDYVRKFLRMVQNHVVGPRGFMLSVPCLRADGTIDEIDKALLEKAFARWAKRGVCEVTGRLSFTQVCRLLILMAARDGEFLVRRVRDRSLNVFGYALQIIDPVLLDENYRVDFTDGRRIRMGVEINAWGRPIAYHLLSDVENAFGGQRIRVPASEIWHGFIQEEPDQVRGVPWIHSAMRRLNDLGGFEEAAIIAARVGASNQGFFIPPADGGEGRGQLADEMQRGTNADGDDIAQLVRDATPGTFDELPPGYDFKQFDPDYPHANFDSFVKAMLRGVSSGLPGSDYNTMANDLENVNFSSIRSGKLESQDEWMCLQQWFDDCTLDPLWPELLEMSFLSNQLGALPVSKFDKFNCAVWQGRRWPWVDPYKDAQAKVLEINNGLTSYSAVMRELGRDPEATWRELEKDKARLKDLLPKPPPPAQSAGGSTSDDKKDTADE